MDTAAFEQMYEAFWEFRWAQGVAGPQAELPTGLPGALPRPARRRISPSQFHRVNGSLGWAIQRFLTKAPWDHDAVIDRLEEYLAPWLGHPEAVWVVDGTDFPKQDGKRENRGGARPLGA